ncbi:hypothetical protein OH76DRAFT_1399886 [Lentinus brumalis]|uniref:Uncharacterized protein n=1 Tax=Lentinus brumalis TaxID=2498619 RepID=A0A371DL53_9APHY|nr:hypothetical protein OH76DRAFT_1399886 [Polyporus brumalis]
MDSRPKNIPTSPMPNQRAHSPTAPPKIRDLPSGTTADLSSGGAPPTYRSLRRNHQTTVVPTCCVNFGGTSPGLPAGFTRAGNSLLFPALRLPSEGTEGSLHVKRPPDSIHPRSVDLCATNTSCAALCTTMLVPEHCARFPGPTTKLPWLSASHIAPDVPG